MESLNPSTQSIIYIVIGIAVALGAVVPGWLAFRRAAQGGSLPIATLERDRYKMAARIYELENQVSELQTKLVTFDSMAANIDRLQLENLTLHRKVDGMQVEVEQLQRENKALRGNSR